MLRSVSWLLSPNVSKKGSDSIFKGQRFSGNFKFLNISFPYTHSGTKIGQSVYRLATGWTIRGSNPGGDEIFRTRPDRPWGLLSLLYSGYRVSPRGVKWPGRGVEHPPPSNAEVEGRVELHICSPSGPSWLILGRPLPLPLHSRFS